MRAPFQRLDPTGPELPIVVEIPHAGLHVAAPFLALLAAPARSIARDADLHVDALYEDAPAEGATVLISHVSRYVIDVNRAEADIDADVVEGGRNDIRLQHGLVWRTTSDGEQALMRRLTAAELRERLDLVWRPYHRELSAIIERKLSLFGTAIVLAAHSMPSSERGRRTALAQSAFAQKALADKAGSLAAGGRERRDIRADVVPGSRGRRSAAGHYIDAVELHAVTQGWSVRHDDPYAGGYTTQHYGRPADRVHVVQIELARRLYLDEEALRPLSSFGAVRAWCRALVAKMGQMAKVGNEGHAGGQALPAAAQ
jgi:N-formylglutamate deformylase